jgi:hypothetical protein
MRNIHSQHACVWLLRWVHTHTHTHTHKYNVCVWRFVYFAQFTSFYSGCTYPVKSITIHAVRYSYNMLSLSDVIIFAFQRRRQTWGSVQLLWRHMSHDCLTVAGDVEAVGSACHLKIHKRLASAAATATAASICTCEPGNEVSWLLVGCIIGQHWRKANRFNRPTTVYANWLGGMQVEGSCSSLRQTFSAHRDAPTACAPWQSSVCFPSLCGCIYLTRMRRPSVRPSAQSALDPIWQRVRLESGNGTYGNARQHRDKTLRYASPRVLWTSFDACMFLRSSMNY